MQICPNGPCCDSCIILYCSKFLHNLHDLQLEQLVHKLRIALWYSHLSFTKIADKFQSSSPRLATQKGLCSLLYSLVSASAAALCVQLLAFYSGPIEALQVGGALFS